MKKRIPIIISLLITAIVIIGCVKKLEKVTTALKGRVIEETSMLPLNNVNVVVTNGISDYINVHTGVTGTFKLDVNFDDISDGYYLYLDDGSHTKKLELKGIGKVSYDYKDIALYNNGGGASTPTVSTSTPTNITSNSATCGGNVTNDGGANVIQRGVCYSTSPNPNTSNGTIATSGTGTGEYTCNLTGLTSNTKYYVRAYAINSVGTSYGTQKDFTTSSGGGGGATSPTVTINEPSNITSTTATCSGNVTSEGSASVTERGICYNTSGTPTTSSNKVTSGSGGGAFTCNLTGLTPNTKYYVRAYAKSSAGTSYSSQKEFTTSSGGGGSSVTEFTEGFETGLPSTWATIDADGDGYNWYNGYSGHNGSSGLMTSDSYSSGVLYPDNYLVTPRVKATANSTFSFWARAGHTSWPNEHFGVFVSTSSQTNASSFVKIQEWTMSAKGSNASDVGRDGQTRTPGTWYRYTVNLGSYANQNLYIAIRHFDCSDEYCLDVDDVELSTSGGGGGSSTATIILTAGNVWNDGTGYQMLLDNTHSLYGTTIPTSGPLSTNCSGNESIYAQFSHKIPTNADGNCSTSHIVLNNSVSIIIPAGIYDWCITNPTPDDKIWIAASNGNVGGRQDNYEFVAGNTYEFVLSKYDEHDGVDVTITGGAKGKQSIKQSNIDCKSSN
jgi:hypothetical protein